MWRAGRAERDGWEAFPIPPANGAVLVNRGRRAQRVSSPRPNRAARAGQALVQSLNLPEIAHTIVTRALEVSSADAAILFRFDEQSRVLVALAHAGAISDRLLPALELPLGVGAPGIAAAERRPVVSARLDDDPAAASAIEMVTRWPGEGLRSVMAIPLSSPTGAIYGALSVFYRRQREFAAKVRVWAPIISIISITFPCSE